MERCPICGRNHPGHEHCLAGVVERLNGVLGRLAEIQTEMGRRGGEARCPDCLSPVGARHYCTLAPAFVSPQEGTDVR